LTNVVRDNTSKISTADIEKNNVTRKPAIIHTTNQREKHSERHACAQCEETFRLQSVLKRHITLEHGLVQVLPCPKCAETFTRSSALQDHIEDKHIQDTRTTEGARVTYTCTECGEEFIRRALLRQHERRVHRIFACLQCDGSFNTAIKLNMHIRSRHAEQPCVCEQCGMKCLNESRLEKHKTTHTGEKKHACLQCNKMFRSANSLSGHTQVAHSDERPFSCTMCPKGYIRANLLKRHMRISHSNKISLSSSSLNSGGQPIDKSLMCRVCSKVFASKNGLKVHEVIHTGEKPYACEQCDKRFSLQCNRICHIIQTHNTDKHVMCEHCGLKCMSKAALKVHMVVHTKEKPFSCLKCNKKFSFLTYVRMHDKLVHKKERPFVCVHCGKDFQMKCQLVSHELIHKEEK